MSRIVQRLLIGGLVICVIVSVALVYIAIESLVTGLRP